jgi:hypothetical protein
MDVLIKITSEVDHKLITDLAKRLGLPNKTLSTQEKEDYAFLIAMDKAKASGIASTEKVMAKLRKIASKK